MTPTFDVETWRAHAALTRKLVDRAHREGNLALARELTEIAEDAEAQAREAEALVPA